MRLLKTIVVVTLVAGLLIGGALPVLADTGVATNQSTPSFLPEWGKGHWGWGKVRAIRGEVTSVGTNEIKVDGKTIMVDENTQIRVPTLGKERSLSDIQVGMQIVALVYEKDGDLYARHIVVVPGRPQFRHHVGEVVEYIEGDRITIQPLKEDNPVTFTIVDGFKILPPGATVEEGAWVTVISHRDPVSDRLIANGVVVHPAEPRLALKRVTGTIEAIDKIGGTITVDTTVVKYDDKTIFILRGIPAVVVEKEALALCREQPDGTLLAKVVLVGIDLPGVRVALGETGP